jgi:hypothetical protein
MFDGAPAVSASMGLLHIRSAPQESYGNLEAKIFGERSRLDDSLTEHGPPRLMWTGLGCGVGLTV